MSCSSAERLNASFCAWLAESELRLYIRVTPC
jgi:hypothetical protein